MKLHTSHNDCIIRGSVQKSYYMPLESWSCVNKSKQIWHVIITLIVKRVPQCQVMSVPYNPDYATFLLSTNLQTIGRVFSSPWVTKMDELLKILSVFLKTHSRAPWEAASMESESSEDHDWSENHTLRCWTHFFDFCVRFFSLSLSCLNRSSTCSLFFSRKWLLVVVAA